MFELSVETTFAAAHAIVIRGEREPVHGHNWHVTAVVAGPELDDDGLLVDFHAVERALARIVEPFRNNDLNKTPPFDRTNPSAENVAVHIARELERRLAGDLPPGSPAARVQSVRVTEAPGCAVLYRPPSPPHSPDSPPPRADTHQTPRSQEGPRS